jgi:peptidoglycan/xylan/chitin deacetylase (PgdA/CDA1 family)
VRLIRDRGHAIGNHSYRHPSATFWCLPRSAIALEIDRCTAIIGKERYFRAPVGMKNPAVHPILAERDMRLIGWSVRGFDTVTKDPDRVVARILPRVKPGAIIVMHQGRPQSVLCLERLIAALQRDGYSFAIPADDRLKMNK